MTADEGQFLNTTRFGATAAAAATHGTAVDVVQLATPQIPIASSLEPLPPMCMPPSASTIASAAPATPQTPTAPALEPLPPMGMVALCFENSIASVMNDIVCRVAAQADGHTVYMIVAQVGGHVATCRRPNASCSY